MTSHTRVFEEYCCAPRHDCGPQHAAQHTATTEPQKDNTLRRQLRPSAFFLRVSRGAGTVVPWSTRERARASSRVTARLKYRCVASSAVWQRSMALWANLSAVREAVGSAAASVLDDLQADLQPPQGTTSKVRLRSGGQPAAWALTRTHNHHA